MGFVDADKHAPARAYPKRTGIFEESPTISKRDFGRGVNGYISDTVFCPADRRALTLFLLDLPVAAICQSRVANGKVYKYHWNTEFVPLAHELKDIAARLRHNNGKDGGKQVGLVVDAAMSAAVCAVFVLLPWDPFLIDLVLLVAAVYFAMFRAAISADRAPALTFEEMYVEEMRRDHEVLPEDIFTPDPFPFTWYQTYKHVSGSRPYGICSVLKGVSMIGIAVTGLSSLLLLTDPYLVLVAYAALALVNITGFIITFAALRSMDSKDDGEVSDMTVSLAVECFVRLPQGNRIYLFDRWRASGQANKKKRMIATRIWREKFEEKGTKEVADDLKLESRLREEIPDHAEFIERVKALYGAKPLFPPDQRIVVHYKPVRWAITMPGVRSVDKKKIRPFARMAFQDGFLDAVVNLPVDELSEGLREIARVCRELLEAGGDQD
jgi:hypothetical protein